MTGMRARERRTEVVERPVHLSGIGARSPRVQRDVSKAAGNGSPEAQDPSRVDERDHSVRDIRAVRLLHPVMLCKCR